MSTQDEPARQIASGSLDRPHFRVVRRGYDRQQVDAFFGEYDRFAQLVGIKAAAVEEGLDLADQQVRALESNIAKLATAENTERSESHPLADAADRILDTALEGARQVRAAIEGKVRAYKDEAEQYSSETLAAAEARATEIVESARACHGTAIESAHEERARAEQLREWVLEAGAALEVRMAALWRQRVEKARREAEILTGQRQDVLDDLAKLKREVGTLTGALKGRP